MDASSSKEPRRSDRTAKAPGDTAGSSTATVRPAASSKGPTCGMLQENNVACPSKKSAPEGSCRKPAHLRKRREQLEKEAAASSMGSFKCFITNADGQRCTESADQGFLTCSRPAHREDDFSIVGTRKDALQPACDAAPPPIPTDSAVSGLNAACVGLLRPKSEDHHMVGTDDPRTSTDPKSVTESTLVDRVGVHDSELQEMKYWIQHVNPRIDDLHRVCHANLPAVTGNIGTEMGALAQKVNDLEKTSSSVEDIRTLGNTLQTSMGALETRVGKLEDLRPTERAIDGADQQRMGDQQELLDIRKGMTQIRKSIGDWKIQSERTQGDLTDELTRKVLAKVDSSININGSGSQDPTQDHYNKTQQDISRIDGRLQQLQDRLTQSERDRASAIDQESKGFLDEVDKMIESRVRTYGIQEQIQVQRNETRQELGSITSRFQQLQDSFSQLQIQSQAQSNRLSKAAEHFEQQKKQHELVTSLSNDFIHRFGDGQGGGQA